MDCFLDHIERVLKDWRKPFAKDTAQSFMSEVVSKSINPSNPQLVLKIISTLSEWSQQTYEGDRIVFSLGISGSRKGGSLHFEDLEDHDFFKVMSNGHDTALIFDDEGLLVSHKIFDDDYDVSELYSPIRFSKLAAWTKDTENIIISLNRGGEILIFKDGNLCFAKRRGYWRYFAHESVIKRLTNKAMGRKSSETLRKEIYLTALDVSFAKTGGCIGVLNARSKPTAISKGLINDKDLLEKQTTSKSKALNYLIKNTKFQNLDRLLRLELVSIDGATVLDHEGNFLATGAILSVEGGSSSGGRQAATVAVAKYGLGIKISNDGYIKAINRDKEEIVRLS